MKPSAERGQGHRSIGRRLGVAFLALVAACITAALPPGHVNASSSPPAVLRLPGPIDTVYADPTNVMYGYGPSEADRFSLQAASAFTANITVTYTGFSPQAQAAFQAAVDIWQSVIVSPVPIRVNARYENLGNPNILGSAGPTFICGSNSLPNTYYAAALADKLFGSQFCSNNGFEINAHFNSTFTNWDFGTSGTPVSGKYNFLTVVMHELGHGLGFYGSMTASGGTGSFGRGPGFVDIYDRFAVTGAGAPLIGFVNPSTALGTQLVSDNTFFNGSNAKANNSGVNPKLETHFFPSPPASNGFLQGSSYSHLDDALYTGTPNGLMTWALGQAEVYTDPGPIMRGMFVDEGWTIAGAPAKAVMTSPTPGTTIGPNVTFNWTTGTGVTLYDLTVGSAPGGRDLFDATDGVFTTANVSGLPTDGRTLYVAVWSLISGSWQSADYVYTAVNIPPTRIIALSGNLAFGSVPVGQTPTRTLTISNAGNSTMTVSSISYPAGFSGNWSSGTIAAGGSQPVTVTFAPKVGASYGGTITVSANQTSGTNTIAASGLGVATKPADFDGDGKTDMAVYRPSNGTWYVKQSGANYTSAVVQAWGLSTDIPLNGDYDGDGRADLALFRPSTATWYVLLSSTNYTTYFSQSWGLSTDVPVPGDYDGDGKTDLGLYRPSTGTWYVLKSSTNYTTFLSQSWGLNNDVALASDYDGDGKTDLGLFRPSTGVWYILTSSSNYTSYITSSWGLSTDVLAPGDYDGDGRTDLGLYRPSTGVWYILTSSSNYTSYITSSWGLSTDIIVPGEYDGDGKTDLGLYRPSTGVWYILTSSSNFTSYITTSWGLNTDIALLKR